MIKRITTNQYITQISKYHIKCLGEYINYHTKIKHQCGECGHIWNVAPTSIKSGRGCPKCANNQKLSHKEFQNRVSSFVEVIGVYISMKDKIEVQCKVCLYVWHPSAGNISKKNPTGCPKCAGQVRLTQSEFESKIYQQNPTLQVVGEYNGPHKSVDIHCKKCDYRWSPSGEGVSGCPKCSSHKTKMQQYQNAETFLYYIKIQKNDKTQFKVGICKRNRQNDIYRALRHRFRKEYDDFITLIEYKLFQDGFDAYKLEQEIILEYKSMIIDKSERILSSGHTETFNEQIIF